MSVIEFLDCYRGLGGKGSKAKRAKAANAVGGGMSIGDAAKEFGLTGNETAMLRVDMKKGASKEDSAPVLETKPIKPNTATTALARPGGGSTAAAIANVAGQGAGALARRTVNTAKALPATGRAFREGLQGPGLSEGAKQAVGGAARAAARLKALERKAATNIRSQLAKGSRRLGSAQGFGK